MISDDKKQVHGRVIDINVYCKLGLNTFSVPVRVVADDNPYYFDEDDVMLITDTGTIIRINAKDISVLGRSTQGVTLMRTNEGKVVSIEKIEPEKEE